jgi:hypothetical protein
VNGAVAGGAAESGGPAASGGLSPLANGAHPAPGDAETAGQAPGNDTGSAAQAPGNEAAGPGAGAVPAPRVLPASPVPPPAEGGADPAGD